MTTDDSKMVREFVALEGYTPAQVMRDVTGSLLVILVRPANSSRTLRVVATTFEVEEL